ncbi:MAG: S41 family peptidase [Bacteroidota bacterium]
MKACFSFLILLSLSLSICLGQQNQDGLSEKSRVEKWMEDISYFEDTFLKKAKTYTKSAKDSCFMILADVKSQLDSLSDFQIRLALIRSVVLADNAHTTMLLPKMEKVPLRFFRFAEGLFIVKTDSASSAYLGARVIQINGHKLEQVEQALFPYLAGIDKWKKYKTPSIINSPEMLYQLGMGIKDSIFLDLVLEQDTLQASFGTKAMHTDRYWFESWANLYPKAGPDHEWRFIKSDTNRLPLYLQQAEKGVFFSFLEEEKIAYFHINSFWEKCPDFKGLIEDFHKELKRKADYDVVIDLRNYTGGNYGYAVKLASEPPKIIHEDKKIYLITSNRTYSAGIVTAARIKYYAKERIVIVGEEVGDRLRFWAESVPRILPHSGYRVYDAREEHDWKDGKRRFFRTHFPNFLYGVPAKELDVDQKIVPSFLDFMEDRDPVMEWILAQ